MGFALLKRVTKEMDGTSIYACHCVILWQKQTDSQVFIYSCLVYQIVLSLVFMHPQGETVILIPAALNCFSNSKTGVG